MYQASKNFGDAIAGPNRKFNTRLLENGKVLVESVKSFTKTSGAEEITIGSAVASYIQATVENKGISLSGKEVSLEIGVEVDGEMEYIPMGLYTIQNPKIESNKVTFTAYDPLANKCNAAYYSKLEYPVDALDILDEISNMTGVPIDTSTLQRGIQIDQRTIIEEGDYDEVAEEDTIIMSFVNPFNGYTYKETIGFIAGLFGKFATCGRTGEIQFRWYQDITYEIQSNIFYNDLQETEESFSIERLTCDNSDQALSSGTGTTGISMQNPVMTQDNLDNVFSKVKGLTYTPAVLRFIGDMRLDIGDIVTAVKNDGTKFKIPIISLITSFDGGLMQTVASYGNTAEEDDSDTKGPLTEMAERVEYELAFVKKLMVDNLVATNATIKNLSGDVLKFKTGEFETLKTDVANFKQTFTDDLQASNAKISNLESDHATFKEATATNFNATNARIANIEADYLKATDAQLTYATITNLNTANAAIEKLQAKDAAIDKLVATKATITDLNAAVGRVGVLESGYADLNTLVNGNLTSANIQNLTLTSKNTTIENGMIKNAMIENLSFDKIIGIDINTTNLTVHSSDGKSKWSDNTIQISDANRVRVQIGKDASNDYSMSVWDASGNLIWDALGATEKTIQRKIIRNSVVADDANISGSKLDINSVIKEVNGSTTKLKSSTVAFDDRNQTLDVVFNTLETTVNNIEVGGRNIYTGTKDFSGPDWAFKSYWNEDGVIDGFTVMKRSDSWMCLAQDKQVKAGEVYTCSMYLKTDTLGNWQFGLSLSGTGLSYEDFGTKGFGGEANTWYRISKTIKVNKDGKMHFGVERNAVGGSIWVYAIKLEKGNKPTDWTPAPEDTDEIISSHTTSIGIMQGQISTLISDSTTIKGNYDTLIDNYNSTVNTVNSMKTTIGEHTTKLNNQDQSIAAVSSRTTTIEASLSGLTTRVSATEAKYDNLEIGGRNLVAKDAWNMSKWQNQFPNRTTVTTTDYKNKIVYTNLDGGWEGLYKSFPVVNGQEYTLSFDYKVEVPYKVNSPFGIYISSSENYNMPIDVIARYDFETYVTELKRASITFTATSDTIWVNLNGGCISDYQTGLTFEIDRWKLEKGNKPTDWTPAPEDVDQQITAVETIASQTANKFNWLVKSGTNTTDFELTDRTATLVASAINMNGLVTFSGLNSDLQNTINNKTNVSYFTFNGYGDSKPYFRMATIQVKASYVNQNIIIGANHRGHGYTECRIRFVNSGGLDPDIAQFSMTGQGIWRVIKTGTSTWDLYLMKSENYDGGSIIKYVNPYSNVVVTWIGENADLPDNTRSAEQMIADQTTIDGGIITTGKINADRIDVTGIFAKDITATGTITGVNLVGATGTFSGKITATDGTVGGWNIAPSALYSGINKDAIKIYYATTYDAETMYKKQQTQNSFIVSQKYLNHFVSRQVSVGRTPYWQTQSFTYDDSQINLADSKYCIDSSTASNYDTRYSLKESYISSTRIYMEQNITQIGGGVIKSSFWMGLDSMMGWCYINSTNGVNIYGDSSRALYVQSNDTSKYNAIEAEGDVVVTGKIHAYSGSNKIQLNANDNGSIELYGSTPFIDFHNGCSDVDYTSRIIANSSGELTVCGKLRCDSNIISNNDLIANSWIYAGASAHYTWQDRLDCYFTCGNYSGSNNIYYYAGYHAFYVNSDSGSGMFYVTTNGCSSRKGFSNSSDERIKKDFRTFDDDFIKSYMQLEPIKYRFKDDTDNSYHIGFKAQNVNGVLNNYGKSRNEQFGICATHHIDPDYAEKAYGEKGMTEVYTLAYDELIGANTFMIQKTRKDLMYQAGKIDMQEAIINDLQTRLLQAEKTIKQNQKQIEQLSQALA